jgi:serine/threonine protein kinase/predicted Zn-dependent protease
MNDSPNPDQTANLSPGAGAAAGKLEPEKTSADPTVDSIPGHTGSTTEWSPVSADDNTRTIHYVGRAAQVTDGADFELGAPAHAGKPTVRPDVAGYEILEELGRGGMGVVYKARHIKLDRLVALKMVIGGGHASAHQLARFHTEAEAVAQLHHSNIVQIYEVGDHEGLPYFSLELLEGGRLSDKIDNKPLPPRDAASTVLVLANAMAAAHARGVIHRDLKPTNILLSADGTPKITDFGLAKRLEGDSNLTRSGTVMGTPSYMSPEQARGEGQDLSPSCDLYSLGAILYELLTGRPPFVGPTMMETLYQVRYQEPVPPSRLQPKCPRDLETICLKCLHKEANRRYPDCVHLAQDLSRFLAGEPIHARPAGRVERAWRWCKRNPRVAALSGAVTALLLVLAVGAVVMTLKISRERTAVAESRHATEQRLQEAETLSARGNYLGAQDLLRWSDPLLNSHPDLEDQRVRTAALRRQLDVYGEFKSLLDQARFSCRSGVRDQKEQGRRYCKQLLELMDEIQERRGRADAGLPPLDDERRQHYKEDAYEALLIAAIVERELAQNTGLEAEQQGARQALAWLNRADQIQPGTRTIPVYRAPCWSKLGDKEADEKDMERAKKIEPTLASDFFWRGFADHMRGDQAKRKGEVKAAQESYRKEIAAYSDFLQLRPDHYWGYFNWAACHFELGDLHDSIVGFTTCIRLRPDHPWPYYNRGTAHLRLRRYDLALADFDAALQRNQDYFEAYANRGVAWREKGTTDLALADFDKAIAINSAYDFPYGERADLYRKAKRWEEAIKDYNKFLELRPKDAKAIFFRGETHYNLGNFGKAHADFSSVLDIVPNAVDAIRNRAIVSWMHLKDFDAALTDFQRLTELQPKDAEPYRLLGSIYLGRRSYERAEGALQQAIARKPDFTEVRWALAQIYLWQGKYVDALAELDPPAARLPKGPPETLNVRGDVYRAMGRLKEAAADYEHLIQLKPDNANAYVSLAIVCDLEKQPERASQYYERLVAAAPDAAQSHLLRAAFWRDRREFARALEDCATASRKDPESALVTLVRAGIKAAQGEHEQATAEAEQALKSGAKDDGRLLYAAACVWSLAARSAAQGNKSDALRVKAYADRGAALLADALGRGFHDLLYPEHNRMQYDPALAALREHPRVRALLAHEPNGGD